MKPVLFTLLLLVMLVSYGLLSPESSANTATCAGHVSCAGMVVTEVTCATESQLSHGHSGFFRRLFGVDRRQARRADRQERRHARQHERHSHSASCAGEVASCAGGTTVEVPEDVSDCPICPTCPEAPPVGTPAN